MNFLHRKEDMRITVTGLGYDGLPLTSALGMKYPFIGFDRKVEHVAEPGSGVPAATKMAQP